MLAVLDYIPSPFLFFLLTQKIPYFHLIAYIIANAISLFNNNQHQQLSLLSHNTGFARQYPLLPNSKGFARLYLLPDKTLIFKLSGVIPVPLSAETYPSQLPQKHNSFSPNNPSTPPKIKVSAREARQSPHALSPETDPHKPSVPPYTLSPAASPDPLQGSSVYTQYTPSAPHRSS